MRDWTELHAARHPELARLGYFGSYARGDWGVGSDLDVVAIVDATDEPFDRRSLKWDLSALPVPTEMLVYTVDEWNTLQSRGKGFARALMVETVWVYVKSRKPMV
ncbi:MAG: nucleotidyltransferase domain-containing protein [Gammaproteobacteria bacterium]